MISRPRNVCCCACRVSCVVVHSLALSPFPPTPSPETPYEVKVKAIVLRQQKERTDERIRQLRRERRDNIIRETVD
jgi:hypothetical protein